MLFKPPLLLFTLVVLFASQEVFSQNGDDDYVPRPFEEKDVFIDIYSGYPNWGNYFLEEFIEDNDYDFKEIPHIGGRLELATGGPFLSGGLTFLLN